MPKIYTVVFSGVAVTAQQDLFEITSTATRWLAIHAVELSQSTEVGDTAEEGLSILFRRGVGATSGTGGSSFTPVPRETNQGAAGFTAEINNTTRMTGGTITTLISSNWNERISPTSWDWSGTALMPIVGLSERFTVELATTPADSITMSGTIWVEEIG